MSASRRIVCVVEGAGDAAALPRLVSRWLTHHGRARRFHVYERAVIAKSGDRLVHAHDRQRQLGVEYYVEVACNHAPDRILVLLDADDHCVAAPRPLGPELAARARTVVPNVPLGVVVANREFEAWFLGDLPNLRRKGLVTDVRISESVWQNPDLPRDCKGLLARHAVNGYRESRDQLRFVEALSRGRRLRRISRSYRKLHDELTRLTR